MAKGYFTVRERTAALVSMSIAAAALTAVVVVAAVDDDALATIALALAVVAFVIQILIFLAQTVLAGQQAARAATVYDETLKALERISASTEGTKAAVEGQLERLLGAVLTKNVPESLAAGVDVTSPEFTSRVASEVAELIADAEAEPDPAPPRSRLAGRFPRRSERSVEEDAAVVRLMTTFPPPDESVGIIERLQELEQREAYWLASLARDEVRFRAPDAVLGPGLYLIAADAELFHSKGWVEIDAELRDDDGDPLARLTDAGRRHGRVYTARGRPPEAIREQVRALRVAAREYEAVLRDLQQRDRSDPTEGE